MEITYLGHACFKLKSKKSGMVITDPYAPSTGPTLSKPTADIVTLSHSHADHSAREQISGIAGTPPLVIDTAGDYEIKGISLFGISSYHDNQYGALRGPNIIFNIIIDGISVCHLGDLGQESLTSEQVARIGEVDVLLCPVGGYSSLDAKAAIGVLNQLEPKVFVPMHYRTPAHNPDLFSQLAPLESFTNEYGIAPTPIKKLDINKDRLGEETEVVVFLPS